MGLSIYIYVGGVRTSSRTFYGGTTIGVHGKLSSWLVPIPGAIVTTKILGVGDTCYTDIAGWYKCTSTIPVVRETTTAQILVVAQSPMGTQTRTLAITVLGTPQPPVPPPEPPPPPPPPIPPDGGGEWWEKIPKWAWVVGLVALAMIAREKR